jgi:hypothetical protein
MALTIRWSTLLIAAATLAACGDGSSGSGNVNVPNVVGDSQAAATTAITGGGLTLGTVTMQSNATIASGDVISENPAAGASVANGSAVALVVSSGPAKVAVPNVVGDTQAAATTAITGAGLAVGAVTHQSSATVSSGEVISENPAAKTSVTQGSMVALVISTGPPTYTIGGKLIGLAPKATVHVLNGADSLTVSANGSFTLPTAVASGGTYSVTVGPPSSAQACAVQNASGTIAAANVTSVVVYCTYSVNAAKLSATFTSVGATFENVSSGVNYPYDYVSADTFDGVSAISSLYTINVAGTTMSAQTGSSTYAVTTANAIPLYTDSSPGLGGIEGANGNAIVSVEGMASGIQPQLYVAVLPNTNATTDSVNGNYTLVLLQDHNNGDIEADEGAVTLTNGNISGQLTINLAGTVTTDNPAAGQFTISNGLLSGRSQGAVSVDGDLIIAADTHSGDYPTVDVLVPQGSGETQATFEGVYSGAQYGGLSNSTTFGKAITLFAYGNGTWNILFTKNAQGTITTDNTGGGTYTVAADGTLTLTDDSGNVYNGAISADGNVLVMANVSSSESPAIAVAVRQ